ncbi:hypothetical protein [Streptomyces sp. NPDC002908]|uniref:hypothetical protein n=1 Tax=Streptomyces sp. NPDC002908 TaxID=3364670 RepID=UPI0036A70692
MSERSERSERSDLGVPGRRRLIAVVESAWEELDAPATRRRDFCLDAISDVLETGRLAPDDAERVVERLVLVALSHETCAVRESALHAVCTASTHYQLPYGVVKALAVGADTFEPVLLGYVLSILGATYDRMALPVVERYLLHPDPEVRREAAEAVDELCRSHEFARGESRTGHP